MSYGKMDLLSIDHENFLILAEEFLKREKMLRFRAKGNSMTPFIRDNDIVTIEPVKGTPHVGDVILFRSTCGGLILHRIRKKVANGILPHGDSAAKADGLIPYENVLGKVINVSGNGYNFHLKNPFKYLFSRGFLSSVKVRRYPLLAKLGKGIANIIG
jgi:hypothetical protein